MDGRFNRQIVNEEAGSYKAEKELSIAAKTCNMAVELARMSEALAERVENKLSPISWPAAPAECSLGHEHDTWPEYFAVLREHLQQIQDSHHRIENALDRIGI